MKRTCNTKLDAPIKVHISHKNALLHKILRLLQPYHNTTFPVFVLVYPVLR
jgi:hypothetical protein